MNSQKLGRLNCVAAFVALLSASGCRGDDHQGGTAPAPVRSVYAQSLAAHGIVPLYPPRQITVGDMFVLHLKRSAEAPVASYWDNAFRISSPAIPGSIGTQQVNPDPRAGTASFPTLYLDTGSTSQITAAAALSQLMLEGNLGEEAATIKGARFYFDDVFYLSVPTNLLLSSLIEEVEAGNSSGPGRTFDTDGGGTNPNKGDARDAIVTGGAKDWYLRTEYGRNLGIGAEGDVLLRVAAEVFCARKVMADVLLSTSDDVTAKIRAAAASAGVEVTDCSAGRLMLSKVFDPPLPFGFRGPQLQVNTGTRQVTPFDPVAALLMATEANAPIEE